MKTTFSLLLSFLFSSTFSGQHLPKVSDAHYLLHYIHCAFCIVTAAVCSQTHILADSVFFPPAAFLLPLQCIPFFLFFSLCNLFCHLICVYTAAEKINMISFPSKWKKKKKKPKDIQRNMVMNVWQPESHYKYKSVNVQLPSLSLLFFPRWQISKLSSRMGSVIICRVWLIAFPDDRALWKDFPFFFLLQLRAQTMTYGSKEKPAAVLDWHIPVLVHIMGLWRGFMDDF